ncbi:MAG: hypothetical protein IE885_04975 [Campylobacterales bacterium]|nr:hypothetical protein [Campylobacterales bacterium]
MEQFLPAYDDPLFSILLILVVSLIIALVTYGWGLYKQQKEEGNILKFLEKFDTAECALDTKAMPFEAHMFKPLTLLAKAFETSGEYPKAINIYLYLVKNSLDQPAKLELMARLGKTYLHAGFLERARSIYTEILGQKPRNIPVLYELGVVYEMMHEYAKAKEIIEPLSILGEETQTLKNYLDFLSLATDKQIGINEKTSHLEKLLETKTDLYRLVIESLFAVSPKSAWKHLNLDRLEEILDILWFLPQAQLDLDIITSHKALSTLYYAKGYITESCVESGIFAVDLLAIAKTSGFEGGDLTFSYLCKKCKRDFPVSFNRCPHCMAINSVKVEENIAKANPQTDYSLF